MRFTHPSNILTRHIFLFYFNYLVNLYFPFTIATTLAEKQHTSYIIATHLSRKYLSTSTTPLSHAMTPLLRENKPPFILPTPLSLTTVKRIYAFYLSLCDPRQENIQFSLILVMLLLIPMTSITIFTILLVGRQTCFQHHGDTLSKLPKGYSFLSPNFQSLIPKESIKHVTVFDSLLVSF